MKDFDGREKFRFKILELLWAMHATVKVVQCKPNMIA